jgi:hypothetical protein
MAEIDAPAAQNLPDRVGIAKPVGQWAPYRMGTLWARIQCSKRG